MPSLSEPHLGTNAIGEPPLLRVHGLGGFTVWQGPRRIPDEAWEHRRAGEVFRYLLLQPHYTVAREVLLEALWPAQTTFNSRHPFYHATSALRHILEPELPDKFPSRYLNITTNQISVHLPVGSHLDFEQAEVALYAAVRAPTFETLEAVTRRYAGDLFPLDLYADWCAAPRQRLAELQQQALFLFAEHCLQLQRPLQALELCRQILHAAPWHEDAALLGMKAHLALHNRVGALKLYRALEQTLQHDLAIKPRADLAQLAQTLLET